MITKGSSDGNEKQNLTEQARAILSKFEDNTLVEIIAWFAADLVRSGVKLSDDDRCMAAVVLINARIDLPVGLLSQSDEKAVRIACLLGFSTWDEAERRSTIQLARALVKLQSFPSAIRTQARMLVENVISAFTVTLPAPADLPRLTMN